MFWLKMHGSVTTNSWKLSCLVAKKYPVLLPRTRLKNVPTSCQKYPVGLTGHVTCVGLLNSSNITSEMFYMQVVTLIKSHESGCFFSLVLLLCSVGVFLSLRLCHKQNGNKYQQIILIRWLECERLTRNLLSLLCVVVVAAAGENK